MQNPASLHLPVLLLVDASPSSPASGPVCDPFRPSLNLSCPNPYAASSVALSLPLLIYCFPNPKSVVPPQQFHASKYSHPSQIPSDARAFRGFAGKASLFTEVYVSHSLPRFPLSDPVCRTHVIEAKPGVQLMASGAHRMSELTCARCQAYIGWHILRAHDRSEKWKEGTYLLELECLSSADSSPLSNTGPWHSTDYSDDSS